MIKLPIATADGHDKVRASAREKCKAMKGAWAGFGQTEAAERAKRRLQGVAFAWPRQRTGLPFGVASGPAYFQAMVKDHAGPIEQALNGNTIP